MYLIQDNSFYIKKWLSRLLVIQRKTKRKKKTLQERLYFLSKLIRVKTKKPPETSMYIPGLSNGHDQT